MNEKLKPLPQVDISIEHSDRVIVIPDNPEEKTHGGIIIPQTAERKTFKGRVVMVGPGDEDHPIPRFVRRGAHIAYGKYAGSEYEYRGETFLIMRVSDIIGPVVDPY